jgi:hypothetical protein
LPCTGTGSSDERRVHEQVPQRPDRGHVGGSEQTVWLHQDCHLGPEAAGLVRDPGDVYDPVHGSVRDLRGPFVLGQVQRGERKRIEIRPRWPVVQIDRQPVAERRHPGAKAGVRTIPTEQLPEPPPDREECANSEGRAVRRVGRRNQLHPSREVVRAADPRQLPHILEPKVVGEIVDSPRPEVCAVFGSRLIREPPSIRGTTGAWAVVRTRQLAPMLVANGHDVVG